MLRVAQPVRRATAKGVSQSIVVWFSANPLQGQYNHPRALALVSQHTRLASAEESVELLMPVGEDMVEVTLDEQAIYHSSALYR